ncbi:MAG: hydrolase [Acidobacteria bacterium]|nr:hydrolase [Acidobacteriota bacterium]
MAEVEALPAASVLVLRDGPFEVLMLRRSEQASFVPNAWVFPGGMVESLDHELAREGGDASTLGAMRVAAARELFEETGVWLGEPLDDAERKRRRLLGGSLSFRALLNESPIDFSQLVWTSHWITPFGVPKRFDTYFFLTRVSRDVRASAENTEAVDVIWISPEEALERRQEMRMVFPTIRNLEAIAGYGSAAKLIASRVGVEIEAIQPVIADGKVTLP